jgi:CAAX prenyl protease-like protein
MAKPARRDHGWWPYLAPEFTFLILGEVQARLDAVGAELFRPLRIAIVAALLISFWRRGAYPELRGLRWSASGVAGDVALGLLGTLIWVAPYLLLPAWRPDAAAAFDPDALGVAWRPFVLAVRFAGFALVTPLMEELFIRSFVPRIVDSWASQSDFRRLPIARFTQLSFWVTVFVFTSSHVPWEWPVAIAWCVLANLWLMKRGNLASVIVLHATTNASLFALVCFGSGRLFDPVLGGPLDLWWFL